MKFLENDKIYWFQNKVIFNGKSIKRVYKVLKKPVGSVDYISNHKYEKTDEIKSLLKIGNLTLSLMMPHIQKNAIGFSFPKEGLYLILDGGHCIDLSYNKVLYQYGTIIKQIVELLMTKIPYEFDNQVEQNYSDVFMLTIYFDAKKTK